MSREGPLASSNGEYRFFDRERRQSMDLNGKTAVVTGSARGIGFVMDGQHTKGNEY